MNDAYLYDKSYFARHYTEDKKRDVMYSQELQRIIKRKPHGGKVLDIGCGVGNFLALFDDRWTKHGIEPSQYAAGLAFSKGIHIVVDIHNSSAEYYDLVIFRGTLQHIYNPLETLAEAQRVLKPGGLIVFLATPDADSIVYHIWKTLPPLDAPRNWVVMGSKTLQNILTRLGFVEIEIIHPYLGTPYANPIMDILNFILSFIKYRKFAFPGNMMEVYAVKR
jgi:ubiquinone/menaquinone biosynthesis C-methylase UbiE